MTKATSLTPFPPLSVIIAYYGPGRVLWSALAAALAPKRHLTDAEDLPAYLRKDLGLPAKLEPPRMEKTILW